MEITGTITKVLPERKGAGQHGEWRVASYVLVTGGLRPSYFVFDVFDGMDGRINRLGIEAGKEMTIYFDIDAHEYQGKWFNTIRAYDAREVKK